MVTPLDAVLSFHRALRNDMRKIDDAAYKAAAGDGNLSQVDPIIRTAVRLK